MLPIIIGAILYGPMGGAILGAAFGIVVSIQVVTGAAGAFSTAMLEFQPAATILVCLLKGIAAGAAAGAFFIWVSSWRQLLRRSSTPVFSVSRA